MEEEILFLTPARGKSARRLPRETANLLAALKDHVRLLHDFTQRAFQQGDEAYYGEVAGKLRLLVHEGGTNTPLLLRLLDEFGEDVRITLGGPPIQPLPGEPEPGDRITLREYLSLGGVYIQVPERGLVRFTHAELIAGWSQQLGASHEDWEVAEDLAYAIQGYGVHIMGIPASAYTLGLIAKTVLRVAEEFLRRVDNQ